MTVFKDKILSPGSAGIVQLRLYKRHFLAGMFWLILSGFSWLDARAQCIVDLTPTSLKQPTCGGNDGSFQVSATGITVPYQYKLYKIVNGSPVQQETGTLLAGTLTFLSLDGGTYRVDVSKGGTCSGSITVALPQQELTLNVANVKQPTCGGNDGSFQVPVTGIVAPYQYTLYKTVNGSPVQQETGTLIAGTLSFIFLSGGTYRVDIAKAGTCSGSITVELPQQELTLDVANVQQPTCGGNDGSFQVPVTGIVAPYQYTLYKTVNGSPVQQETGTLIAGTLSFIFLTGGTYQVDIDKGGTCTGSITVDLPQQELVLTTSSLVQPSCGGSDGSFGVEVTGIATPYDYELYKKTYGAPVLQVAGTQTSGSPEFSGLSGGTYRLDISKGSTCATSITVVLNAEIIGKEGCGSGYWKNTVTAWPDWYSATQTVESIFNVPDEYGLDNMTLLEALQTNMSGEGNDGAAGILLTAAMAAVLNADHCDVDYPLKVDDIVDMVNDALSSKKRTKMLDLAKKLDKYNNRYCPLNARNATVQYTKLESMVPGAATKEAALQLTGFPNPSFGAFNVKIESSSTGKVSLRVLDAQGRVIEQRHQLSPNQTLRMGAHYRAGIYMVEVQQDGSKQILKLVKAGN